MKILVTGASGFVGGSFMRRFADRSDLELYGSGRRKSDLPNYQSADLSQPFDISFKPDVVIHCAALASPWASDKEFLRNNVQATTEVIEFCKRNGLPKLVYLSSSSVFYRHENQFNLTEDSPIGPTFVNKYAETKYMGEQLVSRYAGESVILRPRAVFGPGDVVLFPRILAAAAKRKLPIFVSTASPAIGDLIYIDNLCDYMLAAAVKRDISGCYNLTNNQPVPIQAFLFSTFEKLGLPIPERKISISSAMKFASFTELIYRVFRIKQEPPITRFGVSVFAFSKTFNVERSLRDLGPPAVSLEEGIERFVRWQKAQ